MQQISSDLRCCRAPAASLRPATRVHRNVDVLRGAAVQRSAAPSTARRCVNSPQGAPGPPLASALDQVLLHLQVPPGCHPGRGCARQGLPLQQRLQCRQRPGCGRGCGAAGRAVLGKGAPKAAAFWCAARAVAAAGGGASVAKEGGGRPGGVWVLQSCCAHCLAAPCLQASFWVAVPAAACTRSPRCVLGPAGASQSPSLWRLLRASKQLGFSCSMQPRAAAAEQAVSGGGESCGHAQPLAVGMVIHRAPCLLCPLCRSAPSPPCPSAAPTASLM